MRKRHVLAVVLAAALVQMSCQTRHPSPANSPIIDGHTSQIALDWQGTYHGILPCADCAGIETWLTLRTDLTYHLQTRYLGKEDRLFERHGVFTWREDGNTLQLRGVASGLDYYHVGENRLFLLDRQGQKIHGTLAEHYVLIKNRQE